MDRSSRYFHLYDYIQNMINSSLAETWVADPGIVVSDNGDGTAQVQVAILRQAKDKNNAWKDITPSALIPKAVIVYPGNDDFIFTFPLKAGMSGLLVYCDRCIDAWYQSGGVQSQLDIRQHDATDACFIPGLKWKGKTPANINQNSAELRTFSGNTKITFDDSNGIVLTTPNQVKINGNLQVTGSVISGYGGIDQIGVQTHTHASNGVAPTPGT
jgi:hypothetical protein